MKKIRNVGKEKEINHLTRKKMGVVHYVTVLYSAVSQISFVSLSHSLDRECRGKQNGCFLIEICCVCILSHNKRKTLEALHIH